MKEEKEKKEMLANGRTGALLSMGRQEDEQRECEREQLNKLKVGFSRHSEVTPASQLTVD